MGYNKEDRTRLDNESRRTVLLRDKYKCVLCGKKGVQIHEIIPRSALGRNMSEFLFNEKNRVCLCPICHQKAHTRKERIKAYNYLKKFDYIYSEKEIEIIQKFTGELN